MEQIGTGSRVQPTKAHAMGMDVFGREPKNETGKYFRNNVWYWRPLAELCQGLAPEICKACRYWQSNDGDGLDEAGAEALAASLAVELRQRRDFERVMVVAEPW